MYNYKGYTYEPWKEVEPEECIKIFHDVKTPDGNQTYIDWTPYKYLTEVEFQQWIDVGMPTCDKNPNFGNFNHNDWKDYISEIKSKSVMQTFDSSWGDF